MTPEDRTLDGAAVDEVAPGGAAPANPSGEAAPADSVAAGEVAPDENAYHKALDAYMNGDLAGVVKLVDGVLEQKPVAGLKSRLERLRRRATDRLTREKVDAPAESADAAEPTDAEPTDVEPASTDAEPTTATAAVEAAVAPAEAAVAPAVEAAAAPAVEAEAAVAPAVEAAAAPAVEAEAAVAPAVEPAVAEPEPAPVAEAPPADAITAEPPVEPKTEAEVAPAAPAAPAAPEPVVAPKAVDTPTPPERVVAKRPAPGPGPARPSGSTPAVVNRPPSGAPAGAPAGRPASKPGAPAPTGVRQRLAGSGSQPALNAPAPAAGLKAELDRVAGELDRLRKVVSGVEEHIVKVAEAYGKLARDGKRKDQAYDQLYEELRQYKDNFLKTAQKPLFLDVVLLFDGITRTIAQFSDLPDEKVTRQGVVDALSHTRDEILELLYRRDIEKIQDAPKKLDVAIQKPVTRIETENVDEDRDIVQVVREGFRWSGVVLRPQEVVVKRSTKEREPQ